MKPSQKKKKYPLKITINCHFNLKTKTLLCMHKLFVLRKVFFLNKIDLVRCAELNLPIAKLIIFHHY